MCKYEEVRIFNVKFFIKINDHNKLIERKINHNHDKLVKPVLNGQKKN